jgi:sigma-E factor negative regulatory protein RseC
MIEEEAWVTDVEGDRVWVEKRRQSACSACAENCSTSVAGKLFGEKTIRFLAVTSINLNRGDRVVVGLREDALVQGAFRVYLLPLAALFIGAWVGNAVAGASGAINLDTGSILGGIVGLLLSFTGLKASKILEGTGFQPIILRKIN